MGVQGYGLQALRGLHAVQAVQRLFHPPAELPGNANSERHSRIVFITRGLSAAYVAEVFATIRSRAPRAAALTA